MRVKSSGLFGDYEYDSGDERVNSSMVLAKWIKVGSVWVRTDHIIMIESGDPESIIVLSNGEKIRVAMTAEKIFDAIDFKENGKK